MSEWKKTAKVAWQKGYRYLTTPLLAFNVNYLEVFIQRACGCNEAYECACTDASCGCPVYMGMHFYGYDCNPEGAYSNYRGVLIQMRELMEKYAFLRGAIVNEVGMLNCRSGDKSCIPNSGNFPAETLLDNTCPATSELPEGLATFLEGMLNITMNVTSSDGRSIVKSFTWSNVDQDGGTYNLQLFHENGTVNRLGEVYMNSCSRWGQSLQSWRSNVSHGCRDLPCAESEGVTSTPSDGSTTSLETGADMEAATSTTEEIDLVNSHATQLLSAATLFTQLGLGFTWACN